MKLPSPRPLAIEVAIVFILVMLNIWIFYDNPPMFWAIIATIVAIMLSDVIARIRKIRREMGSCSPAGKKMHLSEKIADYTQELGIGRFRKNIFEKREMTIDISWLLKLAIGTLIGLALILIAGYFLKPEFWLVKKFWDKVTAKLLWYCFLWGPIQQFVLQGYVTNKIYSLFAINPNPGECEEGPARMTAAISGLLFFLAHIPNPTLMVVTPIAGAATAYIFLKCRNVFLLGFAHGILGTALTYCLADSMRVGPYYWQ